MRKECKMSAKCAWLAGGYCALGIFNPHVLKSYCFATTCLQPSNKATGEPWRRPLYKRSATGNDHGRLS
jgi:hypothetical protein